MDVAVDKEGFLQKLQDWSPEVATSIAQKDGISLTTDHWEVIELARDFYERHKISPAARIIVKLLKEHFGEEKGTSIYLMQLFSGRPARMVNKIAGLPKPTNCD
ncbi:MAG TPA: sulfurtransferase TusE [Gammaproteobacteria bacterium]|mgnify:CR=1 FL=1|nr:sulfurtransferase TusE [Gammaproteobacteria bacterium]